MTDEKQETQLAGGTYEIIRKRLSEHAGELRARLNRLNADRKSVFGSIEPKLLTTERITTQNNCIARDIVSVGKLLIFAYNVQFGLKSTTELGDVFAVYEHNEGKIVESDISILRNAEFEAAFQNLYKYYKNTIFTRFFTTGPYLYMVFRIGKSVTDVKTFKWLVGDDASLTYVDNRSDQEYKYPAQHEFEWQRTNRDYHRKGKHPHISIDDRVFIETIDGDLTVKIEDNTESGEGIYAEAVEDKEQTLDDAEILYATVGQMILLKIRPYRENSYRYLIYNEKIKEVVRIDEIGESCVLLPDSHGLLFPNGYYLVSGEYKRFDYIAREMLFERRIQSPNGEDTLFVFHNREHGNFVLLSYNLIERTVQTPVQCHGYCLLFKGELLYFRAEDEPQKYHKVQIWQTPFVSPDYVAPIEQDSFLYKIGNKELVRCMAECQNLINLSQREDAYESLYDDICKATVAVLDSYFWIRNPEAHDLGAALEGVRDSASSAIDEYEKVRRIQKTTGEHTSAAARKTQQLLNDIKPDLMTRTDEFIGALAKLRSLRGEIISLRDLRYVDLKLVDKIEKDVIGKSEALAAGCVDFLLRPDALDPYTTRVEAVTQQVCLLKKVADARELEEEIGAIGRELETMIEVVGNLKIEDATKSAQIIEGCSSIFTRLNTARASLKNKRKELQGVEAIAEFAAQVKLLDQNVVNYLDIADSPEKCDEYLNKLLVRIEELEGRFADFDDYVLALTEKREEVSAALESRKVALVEEKNRKAASTYAAAERILKGVQTRAEAMKSIEDIHAYFAADLMIDKVRGNIAKLVQLDDSVKADELQTRLKTIQENAVRQLKDRQELYVDGQNVIRFGKHQFSVNVQKPDLTMLMRDARMCFHITGTAYYEPVTKPAFLETKDLWQQELVSETPEVYRAEYLAYRFIESAGENGVPNLAGLAAMTADQVAAPMQKFMSPRYDEGYSKGVHDLDAAKLAESLAKLRVGAGLLRYDAGARALALLFWHSQHQQDSREKLQAVTESIASIRAALPGAGTFAEIRNELNAQLNRFANQHHFGFDADIDEAGEYLFEVLTRDGKFAISPEAARLHDEFMRLAREHHLLETFEQAMRKVSKDLLSQLGLVRSWLTALLDGSSSDDGHLQETAILLLTNSFERDRVMSVHVSAELEGFTGSHRLIESGRYSLNYPNFVKKLRRYCRDHVPRFKQYHELKHKLTETFKDDIRLGDFQPRVLTSFVRNKLIDDVYLPLIGDNLAKQIGTAGAGKRTDFMGMLLLISPPGYGKTTLMEYVASRLGLIFMKVNGPALGHRVVSLDPADAPNAAAREEVEKINLAFEMGDNIMIYLDDIQHCDPELLQKFISLCDGQRRIEGVWKGRSRTYDLRGRKVCVVMAGNPYTESGEKFKIPDMLANRADTYNLGDIIGDTREAFELSFLENSLTSNTVLAPLNQRSRKDIHALIGLARGAAREGIDLDSNYSAEEINDFVSVLKKLIVIQDVLLKVNLQYIASAAQADAYRTEPPFKLQGSYRNMNKLAEKVLPVMNDEELKSLILSHYEGESQTLTIGAEANLLRFRELTGWMDDKHRARWNEIKKTFQRNQKMHGMNASDSMTQAIVQLGDLNEGVASITEKLGPLGSFSESLASAGSALANNLSKLSQSKPKEEEPPAKQHTPLIVPTPEIIFPQTLRADISEQTIEKLRDAFSELKLRLAAPELIESIQAIPDGERPRGEFLSPGSMRQCLLDNGFIVDELPDRSFNVRRDNGNPIELKVRHDRLYMRVRIEAGPLLKNPGFIARLLEINAEILPVSFGIERDETGEKQLVLLETRDGKDLTRLELIEIIRALEDAAKRADDLLTETEPV